MHLLLPHRSAAQSESDVKDHIILKQLPAQLHASNPIAVSVTPNVCHGASSLPICVLRTRAPCLILSALLLQIYGSGQLQGPSLPTANRTALDQVGAWGMHLVLASGSTGWGQVPLHPWTVSKAALFAD